MTIRTYTLKLQEFEAEELEKVVNDELLFHTDRLGVKTLQGQASQELATATLALLSVERQLRIILARAKRAHQKREEVVINDED